MVVESAAIIGLLKLVGAACLTGSAGGAVIVLSRIPANKQRAKLRKAFKSANIGLKFTNKKKKDRWVYPKILQTTVAHDRTEFAFRLPKGLNPDTVQKSDWVFQQYFGPIIRLEGNAITMKLTHFYKDLEPFDYDYDAIKHKASAFKVPIYVGKNYDGHFVYDMADWPHLLVSGETGAGKSTALLSILSTLIQSIPREKLILHCVDLKISEFGIFQGIADSVTFDDANELEARLMKIHRIMKERGKLLHDHGVQRIYEMASPPPTIILCIDEVALLKTEKDAMNSIEKIGQIGRAFGVFLILSMQRADADILDGKLKQCLTVRISFRQPDEVNSKIAIGNGEAAKISIKDRGRLIIRHETLENFQAPFLDVKRVKSLLEPYKRKETEPTKVTPMFGRHKKDPKAKTVDAEFTVLPDEDGADE